MLEADAFPRSSKKRKEMEMVQVDATLISSHPQHAAADLDSVREFLEVHGSALADFAYILGGGSASRSVFCLIDAVRTARCLTRLHVRELERLLELVFLDDLPDSRSAEAALAKFFPPSWRIRREVCFVADELDALLLEIPEHYFTDHMDDL
ncbi:hypothetical protein K1T73_10445 [Roseovarius sp. SCSIO 43702]|uniref:hypothetical protein n=1 Tax=Roseovarius sp. SCSIO 43702 TaxID=2823043 RepID=UPI001C73DA20|nr:hypothetical protein [Roseovarius sp. SCSIO 43702]QYX55521.1 hypothetical protein K1T73_10445 [Roseovarius sp. SCSIO 43702]